MQRLMARVIFTRDDEWKEVKVGRIFKSSDCIDPNGKASWIKHSQYLAYLGNSQSFTEKMDGLIESFSRNIPDCSRSSHVYR